MGSSESRQYARVEKTPRGRSGRLASDAPDEDIFDSTAYTGNKVDLPPTQRYELWGLGRGVDITKEAPWLEKTAFQVRRVDPKYIVETDEGGLLRGYDELVSHNTTIHSAKYGLVLRLHTRRSPLVLTRSTVVTTFRPGMLSEQGSEIAPSHFASISMTSRNCASRM